ncbi:hypothetical protein H6503_03740 [Candidatus Woesearchaeota archaeon]|nr:hypothetical protein [Candidatus Woesearchaeota archaeon]
MMFISSLKNKRFRDIIFFDRKKVILFLVLSIVSVAIYTTFPLITQFFIRYLYDSDLKQLFYFTLAFAFLFFIKLFIDIRVERYKSKYYLKLEKNLKESIYLKYENNLKKLVEYKSDLFTTNLNLFVLYVKILYSNIISIVQIVVVSFIIFFFDNTLFTYILYTLPVLFLFFLIGKKLEYSRENIPFRNEDFGLMLYKMKDKPDRKKVMSQLQQGLTKKIKDRMRHIPLNVSMESFITFFRLFYMAYFGYYIISMDIHISGLIVGLLYITVFLRPCIKIIQSMPFYKICARSYRKIISLS